MIHAQPLDQAVADQIEDEAVGVVKDRAILDPHPDQAGDVEEPPMGDAVAFQFEMNQTPVLGIVEGAQIAGDRAVFGQGQGHVAEMPHPVRRMKGAVVQHLFEGFRQEGQDQRSCVPVDVEMAGIAAGRTVPQHIQQPGVFQRERRVVGHDIQDDPQALFACGTGQGIEPLAPAQNGIDARRVDDVIAMGRPRSRQEDRRQIQVRYPQAGQIGQKLRHAGKIHAVAHLDPIGCRRDMGHVNLVVMERAKGSVPIRPRENAASSKGGRPGSA